jgi:hypothetical protein
MNSIARPIAFAVARFASRGTLVKFFAASLTLSLGSCMSGILLGALLTPDAPRLPDPRVVRGANLLKGHRIAMLPGIDEVTDIAFGRVDGDDPECLVIAGTRGYALVDPRTEQVLRTVRFEPSSWPPFEDITGGRLILDLDGDGDLELARLSGGIGRSSMHGSDGKTVLIAPEFTPHGWNSATTVDAGDVDGDGDIEFVVQHAGEVSLVNHAGQILWTQDWGRAGAWSVLFLDVNGDRHNDIVYVDGSALYARDFTGKLLSRTEMPVDGQVVGVSLLRSCGTPPVDVLAVRGFTEQAGRTLENNYLVGLDAKTVGDRVMWKHVEARVDAIKLDFPNRPELAWLARKYLQQCVYFAGVKATRLQLRITDNSHKVQYEEILKAPHQHVVATGGVCFFLPGSDGRPARLFVGYGSAVWAYEVRG